VTQELTLPWLLVATPQLQEPSFRRTVVLIVEHTRQGSMGFVINRPIQASLADLVSVPNVDIPANVPAWYGGPVERSTGIILHNQYQRLAGSRPTAGGGLFEMPFKGLALSSSEQTLIDLVDYSIQRTAELATAQAAHAEGQPLAGPGGLYPYRFLVGYSGWGAGQLDEELKQGAWIQAPATQELLFHTSWKTLWDAALVAVGVNPKALVATAQAYLN
jgi:putative transcriptional regulator